ncbi:TIGR02285 family protein [Terasakiella sp. A23]|uniref:TIGR02285 family protein n=1 Tax=Terasakiella sp. FCG-A23 TaxID=3080561 RepID=UPI002952D375|nr:TIGR02285 family protein [Terasakiella sp. A23]MDV7341101.1 TIGR02285 family protein [Terasakiella sp. A23]
MPVLAADPVVVTVSHDMLKGLPRDARCLQKIQENFSEVLVKDEPWKRIIQSLETGKADLTPCIFKNAERETFLDFYGPIAVLPIVLISRQEKDVTLDQIKDLRGVFHLGTSLLEDYTDDTMQVQQVPNIDTIFSLIRSGRVDYSIIPSNFLFARETEGFSFTEIDYIPLYIGVSKKSVRKKQILAELKEKVRKLPVPEPGAAVKTVTWSVTSFPPFVMTQGTDKGEGIADKTVDFYISQTPDYNHKKVPMTIQRVLKMMRDGKPVCNGALLKNKEREEFIDFAAPYIAIYPNGVLTTKAGFEKMRPYLTDDHTVDFELMVKSDQIRLRYDAERSYSPIIDKVLRDHIGRVKKLDKSTGEIDLHTDLKHVLSRNIDAVLGRAEEAYYQVKDNKGIDDLIFLSIAWDKPYQFGHVGCTKGAWNDALIADLNRISKTHRTSKMFTSFYTRWLPPTMRDRYDTLSKDVFGKERQGK